MRRAGRRPPLALDLSGAIRGAAVKPPSTPPASPWQRATLLARTVSHLHPAQLVFRPVHIARSQLLTRSSVLAAMVAGRAEGRLGPPLLRLEGLIPPDLPGVAGELQRARRALAGEQLLVGQVVPLAPPATPFDVDRPKLVLYQQAYLGVARSLATAAHVEGFSGAEGAARLALAHIREFVERVPPGRGLAWDPYPVALRLMNLIVTRELLRPAAGPADAAFLDGPLVGSLVQHARWLAATLELHLLGNHLFSDGAALLVAGAALDAPGSTTWRALGHAIVARSLATDVLPDGGHAERSPMYAALYLDQLQLVIAAARALAAPVPAGALTAALGLGRFLLATAHPDGDLPLLGDSALDEAPLPADLGAPLRLTPDSLRARLYGPLVDAARGASQSATAPTSSFPETGLTVIREAGELLIIDSGPLGTADQPGHAHADALSFELSHHGRRLITDAGAGHYEADEARAYFRGPFGHSAVSVDGQGSDEVWASWRAGRRARVEPMVHTVAGTLHVLRGAVRSAWGWRQERLLFFAPGELLCVVDRVEGCPPSSRVASHLHFAPETTVSLAVARGRVSGPDGSIELVRLIGSAWLVHCGEAHPFRGYTAFRMGEFLPSPELEIVAEPSDGVWCAASAMRFGPDAETALVAPGRIRLRYSSGAVTVGVDRLALRWEQQRPEVP